MNIYAVLGKQDTYNEEPLIFHLVNVWQLNKETKFKLNKTFHPKLPQKQKKWQIKDPESSFFSKGTSSESSMNAALDSDSLITA